MAIRRLSVILSIDVVGYSRIMQSDASDLLSALNEIFNQLVKPTVKKANGRVIKLLGDGALIEFATAYDALTCAHSLQAKMRSEEKCYTYKESIIFRMGVHAGDVLIENQDVFGDGVNIAARLQAEAESGGILISKLVADLAGSDLPFELRAEGTRRLKNISQPIETLSVDFTSQKRKNERAIKEKSIEVQFCNSSDGHSLAWTSLGSGPAVIKAPNWIGHLELDWQNPGLGHLFDSLSRNHKLHYFDARGNGLSDWEMKSVSLELMVDDLEAVMNAAKVDKAPILAISQGCAVATAFAARNPERVSCLAMVGGFAQGRAKRNSEIDRERAKAMQGMMAAGWDDDYPSLRDLIAEIIVPRASREDLRHFAKIMRKMISPKNIAIFRETIDNFDVTALLPKVSTPCLVMHCVGDRMQPIEQGRKLAAGLPNAKFLTFDSNNHVMTENDPCWPLFEREVLSFLAEHAEGN
ncbi:MAG: alpha/beta fold hydrolase [Pseudomonadota bacterium]